MSDCDTLLLSGEAQKEWEIALDNSIENIEFENGYDSDNGNILEPAVSLVSSSAVHSDKSLSVYYQIKGEDTPYRTKMADKEYTLYEIKKLFWRKGNYRFFLSHGVAETSTIYIEKHVVSGGSRRGITRTHERICFLKCYSVG